MVPESNSYRTSVHPRRVRREVFWLLVFVLVVLSPLAFIVRWREKAPVQEIKVNPESPWLLEYKKQGRGYSIRGAEAKIALSPDGNYLAAVCPAKPAGTAPATGASARELVVWRVRDRKEVARSKLGMDGGGRIQWTGAGNYIAVVGRFSHVFHWKSGKLMTAPVNPVIGAVNAGATDLDIDGTQLDLAGDVKVQRITDNSLQAFRISSGAPLPLRWQWQRNASFYSGTWVLALQPNPRNATAKTPAVFAAVLEEEEKPRPRATPTPAPTPTPALTPEQKAFVEKELRWGEEISQLMEKLQGDNPPPEDEVARIETRIKNINAKFRAERDRLFSAPKPAPTSRYVRELRTVRFGLWNLSNNTRVWEYRLKVSWMGCNAPCIEVGLSW
jgi:hypothetical protein